MRDQGGSGSGFAFAQEFANLYYMPRLIKLRIQTLALLLSCTFVLVASGCMHSNTQRSQADRLQVLSQRLSAQKERLRRLEDENRVLQGLVKKRSTAISAKAVQKPVSKRSSELPAPVAAKTALLKAEKPLYIDVLETYRANDLPLMRARVEQLVKAYPDSIHADNAMYLLGQLAFENGYHAAALKLFSRVIREYPKGDKRVSALFAKALVYKKLNLHRQAKKVLEQVEKTYPGSRESFRANMELRLLDRTSS